MSHYESDELLGQYMAFHYGESYFGVGNYPSRCAGVCQELMAGRDKQSALDLGCAVGRSTLELGRVFERVVGLDLSNRFIEAANTLKTDGELAYFLRDEGELGATVTASLADSNLEKAAARVTFAVADACNLGSEYSGFNLIFAGNLIDRLRDPRAFLASVHRHLADDGVLVLSTPYTLMDEFTPRSQWLGGYLRNGVPFTVLDGLKEVLAPHFELLREPEDLPFVIRETKRKYQHTVAELTAWRRTA
ncbi:putative 4-mercaptohistidine N1-methyltransferase [Marinobacter caseinilyticus]|uniref:putative 4-mercaptohistidine N1-methyltransferase n=1 Tax=Marinobacter caseinilyticus TaxID=2692195 RepID=UPI00140C2CEC|nr:putative 4-mercaptohistidine N1-methyltransferase [Marinobacter caseinilyticus]